MSVVDEGIARWRRAVSRERTVVAADIDELEEHLRDQIADLEAAGLGPDEALIIALRRLGAIDELSAQYAREHADRLWKQLTAPRRDVASGSTAWSVGWMLAAAAATAVVTLLAWLGTRDSIGRSGWLLLDIGFVALPFLTASLAVVKRLPLWRGVVLAVAAALLAVVVNVYPFADATSGSGVLVAVHLPVLLWFGVGVAYTGGRLRSAQRWMDFLRFSGEFAVYVALIALGGFALITVTGLVLVPIDPTLPFEVAQWMLFAGIGGAVVVAAWLAEAKKAVIENIAPVLAAIFTPLFAAMIVAAVALYAVYGVGAGFDRSLVTVLDVLLLIVLGLVLYGVSAPDPAGWGPALRWVRVVAVLGAVALDALVLVSMVTRVGDYGPTGGRVAALGLNGLLLVNLAVTAWHGVRHASGLARRGPLESWLTGYLPVFASWTVVVVVVLPPLFDFV